MGMYVGVKAEVHGRVGMAMVDGGWVEEDVQEFLGGALGTLQLFHVLGAVEGSPVGGGVVVFVELSFPVSNAQVLVFLSALSVFCPLFCCFGDLMWGCGPVQHLSVFLQR